MEFIKRREKDAILAELEESFGISKLPYLLIRTGKGRIRAFSGSLSKEEILKLSQELHIEVIGMYLAREENDGIRLSHDSVSILNPQITKNIIEVDEEQAQEWLKGKDLYIKTEKQGKVVIKNNDFLIGAGKLSQGRITNFVPKERRIKN